MLTSENASLFSASPDAILVTDAHGHFRDANPAARQLLGYERDELLQMRRGEVIAPADASAPAAPATDRNGGSWRGEMVLLRKDGAHVPVEASSVVIDDATEPLTVAFLRDLRERKRAEAERRAALEAARAAIREKDQFLAMMSHELRTPLQTVLGYAEYLLRSSPASLTSDQREDVGSIQQGAARMVTLIEQMLELSRLRAEQLALERAPIDPNDLLEHVRRDVAQEAEARGVALRIERPGALQATGDLGQLYQVLLHLVANAVTFTGEGTVSIAAYPTEGGVAVAVRESGIEHAPESPRPIFEEYHQVEGELSRHYSGAGLGLAVAQRLAEGMNGHLSVENRHGSDSTFTLLLERDIPRS